MDALRQCAVSLVSKEFFRLINGLDVTASRLTASLLADKNARLATESRQAFVGAANSKSAKRLRKLANYLFGNSFFQAGFGLNSQPARYLL